MESRPVVLTIAGSDSSGMAGLSADCRTQLALGIHHCPVVTASTAQHNGKVISINPVGHGSFVDQLAACRNQPIGAVKIGLLANVEQVESTASFLADLTVRVVYDPVLASSGGSSFVDKTLLAAIKEKLLPCVTLLTPNLIEAGQLVDSKVSNSGSIEAVAKRLQGFGAAQVLIKGGHGEGAYSNDYFLGDNQDFWLSSLRVDCLNTRGTGCALSSAIASALALEYSLPDAIVIGKMAINQGLRQGYAVDGQSGPVRVSTFPNQQIDLPYLTGSSDRNLALQHSPDCGTEALGLYVIVDRANWLQRLQKQGISSFQLRIKDLAGAELENEIKRAIQLAEQLEVRLFMNDYWRLAIDFGAYGIHLGQEDLDSADIEAIKAAGLRLGISTHCHYEVARANSFQPSYMACGPVFPTTTKDMPWVPHGVDGLAYWQGVLDYPLVAIGGIGNDSIADVAKTGVDGIAMISAITQAENPERVARQFVDVMKQYAYVELTGKPETGKTVEFI
jgi:hydroxymethylpyrimidine kinase/phosphomethylpyrimidine kinase/thiamine-phosphate diphosphorylase